MNRTGHRFQLILFLGSTIASATHAQPVITRWPPNGVGVELPAATRLNALDWGYSYDSLLVDLAGWRNSPYVAVDDPGSSVQGRALWLLTITDAPDPGYRITVHARTHPQEVESLYTTREIIRILIGESLLAKRLRACCVFNIMPMYNPDGVELAYPRENANGVDLERGWDSATPEPEVATLKALFESYMNSGLPVRIALNMHSDGGARSRYFVYHHENGTSVAYTQQERSFIGAVRSYWPEGILDWDGFVSWTGSTPTYYPESWFWLNYGDDVLALTYEDVRINDSVLFERSASAILNGISGFLESFEPVTAESPTQDLPTTRVLGNYPNPFAGTTRIVYEISDPAVVDLSVFDLLGRRVSTLESGFRAPGRYEVTFDAGNLGSGVYLYRLETADAVDSGRMVVE